MRVPSGETHRKSKGIGGLIGREEEAVARSRAAEGRGPRASAHAGDHRHDGEGRSEPDRSAAPGER